jgi:STE24 endopeptidase
MTAQTILACYAALAFLDLAWSLFLLSLNYRSVASRSGAVPGPLAASVSAEEARKSSDYSMARMRLSLAALPVDTIIVVAAAASGVFGLVDAWAGGLARGEYWRGALFLGAILLAQAILSSPFSLYSTFSLEKRFGFNTTSLKTYALDILKGAILSVALGLPMLKLLYLFIDGLGGLWWLVAAAAFSLVNVGLSILYPLLIAPLFNKFTPLAEGSLATRIGELAERVGFRASGIFVMDGSKRSRHSNAYFTGIGRAKRIVLYDTLVSSMPEDEILAVLAHEMGHEKKKHVLKMTIASVALSFVAFWVLDLLMGWGQLYAAFGFAAPSKHAIILILGIVSGPATFFLNPVFSAWSRRHEYQADRFAAEAFDGGAAALSSALVRLNRENASNLWPHRLYSFWHYSHPTLAERLGALAGAGRGPA